MSLLIGYKPLLEALLSIKEDSEYGPMTSRAQLLVNFSRCALHLGEASERYRLTYILLNERMLAFYQILLKND